MDLSDKGSDCEDAISGNGVSILRTCVDCGTSKTPLWRGGPAGPKSLCNACGIRSRKKRRALMGISKEEKKISKKSTARTAPQQSDSGNSCTSSCGGSTFKIEGPSERKLWGFGKNVLSHRPRSNRRKISREEEQAAFLLMALSCGSVYG